MPEPARPQPEFERLYAAHRKAVLAYCLRRAAPSDAHDAAAETFAVAWRRMEAVPAGEDALPWLYGVAYRTLANMRRAARRRSRLESKVGAARLAPTPVRPDIQVVRNAEAEAVVQAMERLRPADRGETERFREEDRVGVVVRTATEVEARAVGLGPGGGAVVVGLSRTSPWREAGLRFGDLIVAAGEA
ncbi:MAG: RNA polymerase sigma factor, partial [Acidimicrobiia bacterium]